MSSLDYYIQYAYKKENGQQLLPIEDIIQKETQDFKNDIEIKISYTIPETSDIPKRPSNLWIKIPSVICCYVDMKKSTQLSINSTLQQTARVYKYFTETVTRIFHAYKSPYIDLKGDGVFALFNNDMPYTALAAMTSAKTFIDTTFSKMISDEFHSKIDACYGIDCGQIMVRKIGLQRFKGRTDKQNEVWAGKVVNISAKLSTLENNAICISPRYYKMLKEPMALKTCGCNGFLKLKSNLWENKILFCDSRFDFDDFYMLKGTLCETHGREFSATLRLLDIKDGP